jgi:hypothetical protein
MAIRSFMIFPSGNPLPLYSIAKVRPGRNSAFVEGVVLSEEVAGLEVTKQGYRAA